MTRVFRSVCVHSSSSIRSACCRTGGRASTRSRRAKNPAILLSVSLQSVSSMLTTDVGISGRVLRKEDNDLSLASTVGRYALNIPSRLTLYCPPDPIFSLNHSSLSHIDANLDLDISRVYTRLTYRLAKSETTKSVIGFRFTSVPLVASLARSSIHISFGWTASLISSDG